MTKFVLWRQFCSFSDHLLAYNNLAFYIPELHPCRPTKSFLTYLESSSFKLLVFLPINIFTNIVRILLRFKLFDANLQSMRDRFTNNSVSSLIFSHFINLDHLQQDDFYFSPLFTELVKRGRNPDIIYISPQHDFPNLIKTYSSLNLFYPILTPFNIIPYLKLFSTSLLSLVSFYFHYRSSYPLSFFIVSLKSLFSVSFFYNFYLKYLIFCLNLPKNFIYFTTFEGHSWERVLFHAFRSYHHSSLGYAYQHTLVFDNNHSLLRSSFSYLNPDFIFVSGFAQFNMFKKFYTCPVHLVGTHKYSYPSPFNKNTLFERKKISILFLPQGIHEECLEHLNLALRLASIYPDIQIIFRTHPLISYIDVLSKVPHQNKPFSSLPNFNYHSCTLGESLKFSTIAIYSGSTAVLEAIQLGIVPIYFLSKNHPSYIDPLWQLQSERLSISSLEDFAHIYLSLESLTVSDTLKSHVQSLKSPFDVSTLFF